VSGPDIRSSAQARTYAAELRGILIATGASDGRMEEGSMRIDANVSVRRAGEPFGTRCEIKNLNSLRSLGRAIDYEAERQVELLEGGGKVRQETRHWDENLGSTSTMRVKEEADDYRYFREPDLVDLVPDAAWQSRVREGLKPMPAERRAGLRGRLTDPTPALLDALEVVIDLGLDEFVIAALDADVNADLAFARAANEIAKNLDQLDNLSIEAYVETLRLEQSGELSATQAKSVLDEILEHGGEPTSIARARGYQRLASGALGEVVATLIDEHPDEWSRFRDGDEKLAQFFIGQVMKVTKGQANGKDVIAELQARR
jgi:aspartyl-tRNA(Asn)/glutamyl-tRNA(Gln) amidotransferase subunit B